MCMKLGTVSILTVLVFLCVHGHALVVSSNHAQDGLLHLVHTAFYQHITCDLVVLVKSSDHMGNHFSHHQKEIHAFGSLLQNYSNIICDRTLYYS